VTGQKLRAYPSDAGLTSFGRAWDNPELRSIAERFLTAIGYRGIADLDFRLDRRTGTYYLIDANPRVGAQFAIARRSDHLDAAQALYRELTGDTPLAPQCAQSKDHALCVENYDALTVATAVLRRRLGLVGWARSLRAGPVEWAWFSVDDLRPWILMWARFAMRILSRPLRSRPSRYPIPGQHRGRHGRARESQRTEQDNPLVLVL
jgi:predicted ATP-grasp superfamily ATP-dependent carboligase